MITDEQISDKLINFLLSLPKEKLLEGLLEALDDCQGYNGNSLAHYIFTAFGFKPKDEGKWVYPDIIPDKRIEFIHGVDIDPDFRKILDMNKLSKALEAKWKECTKNLCEDILSGIYNKEKNNVL